MTFNIFSVALKNLKRKPFRTVILIASLGLLISILVFGASFIISVSSTIKRATDRLGADLLVVPVGARDFAQEVLLETAVKTFYMKRSVVDRVARIDGVERLTYQTYMTTILGMCCDIPAAQVVAFDQETDFIVKPWLSGVIDRKLKKGEAIIGPRAFENLDVLDVDSSVLFNKKFDFVGTLHQTGTGLDDAIFISGDNVSDLIDAADTGVEKDEISVIFLKLKPGFTPKQVGASIETEIVEVDVIERHDMGDKIILTLRDINKIFLITIILAAVIATFLTWSVFSAIANERIREMGIMRAIGARGSHITTMFVLEVLVLGFIGSFLGVLAGTGMSLALSRSFNILRELAATLTISERLGVSVFGLVVGVCICMIGAYSSIMRLRGLDPLSAIKEI